MRMTGVSVTVEPWKLTVSVPVTVTVTVSEQLRTLLGPPGGLFTEGCVALQGGGGAWQPLAQQERPPVAMAL